MTVVLIGVVGVGIVGLFLLLASQKVSDMVDDGLDAEVRGVARWARHVVMVSAHLDDRSRSRGQAPVNLRDRMAVGALDPELQDAFAEHPFVEGLVVWTPDDHIACTVAPSTDKAVAYSRRAPVRAPGSEFTVADLEDGGLTVAFCVPPEARERESVLVNLYLAPQTRRGEGQALVRFLAFAVLTILVVTYVMSAVVLLVNRAQARLQQQERDKAARLKAVGEVAGGIAHEVRNPLNAISLSVQYMERLATMKDRGPSPADFARIHLELGKIRKVVDNFVKFARIRDMVVGNLDLGEVMEEVLGRYADELDALAVRHELVREGDLSCVGDREKLAEVLAAVVSNALEAMQESEVRELRVRVAGERRWIRTTIRDSGEITDENVVRNIFEPYFTTRDSAMGLGMTVARTLVESHGGTIDAAVAHGGGCVVAIVLPRRAVV